MTTIVFPPDREPLTIEQTELPMVTTMIPELLPKFEPVNVTVLPVCPIGGLIETRLGKAI